MLSSLSPLSLSPASQPMGKMNWKRVVFIKCMNIFNHIPSLLPGQVGKWVLFLKTVGCAERLIDWLAACPPIFLCRPDEKKRNEKGPIKKNENEKQKIPYDINTASCSLLRQPESRREFPSSLPSFRKFTIVYALFETPTEEDMVGYAGEKK